MNIDACSCSWLIFLLFLLEVMASWLTFLSNVASHCHRPERKKLQNNGISMTPLRQQFVADASKEPKVCNVGSGPI
jgi:hypothetical protein